MRRLERSEEMKQYLLFDLDGTLTDPKVGITTCVQYALADFGIDEPDLDKLEPFIGPPLKDSFMEFYHMTDEQAQRAIEKYRERFQDTGIFENELYGGIHDLLRTLKAAGMHLAVASSKPTVYVERILRHFKLDSYFEVVLGSELNGERVKKSQVVLEVLRKFFGDKPIQQDEVFVIGDRKYDIEAARAFHVESVGVAYGYGSMEELKEARADYIVKSVAELKKLLMREVDEKKRMDDVHQSQQPGGGGAKPQNPGMKALWRVLLPYLLFLLMKMAAGILMSTVMQFAARVPGWEKYIQVVNGETISLTGLAGIIAQIFSYAAAGFIVYKYARPMIRERAEEMKLTHLKPEPVQKYVILAALVMAVTVGFDSLANMLGLANTRQAYLQMHGTPYDVPILLGLISFGFVTPLAEEIMFRGILYNGIRKFMSPKMALFMSAIFYAYSQGYNAQMIYACVMGILAVYAYEYFGDFRIAVAVHMVGNLTLYLTNYTILSQTPVYSWPSCIVCAVVTGVTLFLLVKDKRKVIG